MNHHRDPASPLKLVALSGEFFSVVELSFFLFTTSECESRWGWILFDSFEPNFGVPFFWRSSIQGFATTDLARPVYSP
jgi:hypothetical protein